MASPLTGHSSALIRTILTPRRYAVPASSTSAASSRAVAPAGRIVRTPESARSTPEETRPSASCDSRVSAWIRALTSVTLTTATRTTAAVMPSSVRSSRAIAMSAPVKTRAPLTASTRPPVSASRTMVVSEPTRETRSPVRRVSYSFTGSRRSLPSRRRRALSTTPSAVRPSRYCWTASVIPAR